MAKRRVYIFIVEEMSFVRYVELFTSIKKVRERAKEMNGTITERDWRKHIKKAHTGYIVYIQLRNQVRILLKEATL